MSYIALTKPRVIELLLVAAIPAMLQADRGQVHLGLVLLTLVGGWLGAASANTLNMVVDADIDKVMKRTAKREPVLKAKSDWPEVPTKETSHLVLSDR
jgi:protoheme IX farnesyltransferase